MDRGGGKRPQREVAKGQGKGPGAEKRRKERRPPLQTMWGERSRCSLLELRAKGSLQNRGRGQGGTQLDRTERTEDGGRPIVG